MRSRLALGLALVAVALLAWLLVRSSSRARILGADGPSETGHQRETEDTQAVRELGASESAPSSPRQSHAGETRFESLPEDPSEILVYVVDSLKQAPVPGAEAFVLEVEDEDWPSSSPDVETLLAVRGKRIESDAQGELRVSIPSRWLALMARTEKLFGEMSLDIDSAPEATLTLFPSADCLVRTRARDGHAVAGVPVVLGYEREGRSFRATSNSAGELRVPNLAWVLHEHSERERAWFAGVADADAGSCLRWFPNDAPLPQVLDLVVGDSQSLLLRVAASDGTPVPVNGAVAPHPRPWAGSESAMLDPLPTTASVPLVHGEARIARAAPGGWLDPQMSLAGGESFETALFVPELAAAPGEVTLRMPERLQAVLARPVDEQGVPLANQEFQWATWAQLPDGLDTADTARSSVRSDEQGLLALVVSRDDLHPEGEPDPGAVIPKLVWRGVLRARTGGKELGSEQILFSALGTGAVRDLGPLALQPARALVRGHVVDESGIPLEQVRIDVEQALRVNGADHYGSVADVPSYESARTDSNGAFTVYGSCTGAPLFVEAVRKGYSMGHYRERGFFECGSSAELTLMMVRQGAIHTSLRAEHGFSRILTWTFESIDDAKSIELPSRTDGGLLEYDFGEFAPGSWRARLSTDDPADAPILEVENVLVRSGERTLDPRLFEIDVSRIPAEAGSEEQAQAQPVVLKFVDPQGNPVPDGVLVGRDPADKSDFGRPFFWHGGQTRVDRELRGLELCVWSPGFRLWVGDCPTSSTECRLEPAWPVHLRVEIPTELRRANRRFLVELRSADRDRVIAELVGLMHPALVGPDGLVTIGCPVECDMEFELQVLALDANGLTLRTGTEPTPVTKLSLHVPAGESVHRLAATAEEWAAAEKALGGNR